MKRIKMMLLSLALFAIVGGALAFKAKFHTDYCYTNVGVGVDNSGIFCPVHVTSTTIGAGLPFVATTTYDANDCKTPNLKCTTTSTKLKSDL